MRKDIQGLRAIAVVAVLLFHFWPNRLPGGYVGVDIFFVISGFLITSHLLRNPPVNGKILIDFWAKRVRRLLPAATLVLILTIGASILWLPQTMIGATVTEAVAAAVYVVNWKLALGATDYFAAEEAATPIQHYWSLSVEEQFYMVWPIIIGLIFVASRRFLSSIKLTSIAMSVLFIGSLTWSIYLTHIDPASAYFVTTTRVWELALGGILAVLALKKYKLANLSAALISWIGLIFIGLTLVFFNQQTPFPGYTALLPTVGTALIIFASIDLVPWSPRRLLSLKPSQFLGDISYSLYLWHWPIVVIAPYALGVTLTASYKLALIALAIALAALSKILIEDGFRQSKKLIKSNKLTYSYGLASIFIIAASSFLVVQWNKTDMEKAAVALEQAISQNDDCLGAGAMRNDGCNPGGNTLIMSPSFAKTDKAAIYDDGCRTLRPYTEPKVCTYGHSDSEIKIALLGNSHAGMWHSALEDIAIRNNWRLDTYVTSGCYTVFALLVFDNASDAKNCAEWNRWAVDDIRSKDYGTVVMSNLTSSQIAGVPSERKNEAAQDEYTKIIDAFIENGQKVFVIRDAPLGRRGGEGGVPDCVSEHYVDDTNICSNPRETALKPDPLFEAVRVYGSDNVSGLDLTDRLCLADRCLTIIGGLIAYFDHGHLSDTFVKTMVSDIEPKLAWFVGSSQ